MGQKNIKTINKKTKYQHLSKFIHSWAEGQHLMSDEQKEICLKT